MGRAMIFTVLLGLAAAVDMHQKVTPVQKVIQLLQGMAEKGKKEKHEEQVQFAAYKQFCDDTTVEKQRAIKEATAKMGQRFLQQRRQQRGDDGIGLAGRF